MDTQSESTPTQPVPAPTVNSLAPIPTPLNLQIRRVRYQVLPIVIFSIALVATVFLWKGYIGSPHGYGEVSAVTVRISASQDGKLADAGGTYPRLFDRVEANQPLARFDASHLIDEQEKVQEELGRLQKQLEDADKAVEDAAKAGADKAKVENLKREAAALKTVVGQQRTAFNHLEAKIKACTVEAPIAGTITAIRHQPNEFVKQGQEIFVITQESGGYILSYVRPGGGLLPKKDMNVLVRGQDGQRSAYARVQEVGTQVEPIPEHQLTNPKKPEWGIPVRISLPEASKLTLRPGELVVLNYKPE